MTDLPPTLNPTLAARALAMETSTSTVPIKGEWDDQEWRSVAARPVRTSAQNAVVAAGPRAHPFGPAAVMVDAEGEPRRIFASQATHDAWKAARAAEAVVAAPPAPAAPPPPPVVVPAPALPVAALPVPLPAPAAALAPAPVRPAAPAA